MRSARPSARARLRALLKQVPGARGLAQMLRRTLLPHHREIHRLRLREADRLLQPFPTTGENRYPELFDALARRLADLPAPRILSFGCSSGEEVRALRRRMPHARITGIDLNRRMIAKARLADPDHAGDYRCDGAPLPGEQFDAVLALAVFRHGDLEFHRPADCSAVLPFTRFEQGLAMLDSHLAPGGWLALYNQQFRLSDTALAPRYQADPLRLPPLVLLYGPDNRRIDGQSESAPLFRKLAEAAQ